LPAAGSAFTVEIFVCCERPSLPCEQAAAAASAEQEAKSTAGTIAAMAVSQGIAALGFRLDLLQPHYFDHTDE
jgi:hypothetical protein